MSDSGEKKNQYRVSGLKKGIRLIRLLAESKTPLALSELSKQLGLNNHMLLRLLGTLQEEGWVTVAEQGPKYQLTLIPFCLVSKQVTRNSLVQMVEYPLQQLCEELQESVSFGVLDNNRVLFPLHLDGKRQVVFCGRVGGRYYLHASAPGKMLLAHAPESLLDRLVDEGLKPIVPNTITSREQLVKELEAIRKNGYSMDVEEYSRGLNCFAGPIFDHTGEVVGTINVSVLSTQYTEEELVGNLGKKVLATCREVSAKMGHAGNSVS